MINWINLVANSLWILGLSLGLATLGVLYWEGGVHALRLRDQLARPGPRLAINLAGLLFCLGLAATGTYILERLLWLLLGLIFLLQIILARSRGSSS